MTARSQENWSFLALLIVGAAFSFAELVPKDVRTQAFAPFLELTLAAAILAATGWAVSVLCDLRFSSGNCALQIGVAQIGLLVWVYFRSILSAAVEHTFGLALPVSRFELLLLIVAVISGALKKKNVRSVAGLAPGFLWVLVAIFLISQRELPREIMLSSDPDHHLFFATQILKFGVVPFHQGSWGPQDFAYPAGLAALSALWSWLGGVSAPNAVTIQPLLQTLLSLLGVAGIAARIVAIQDLRLQLAAGYSVLLLYFGFFPYTLAGPNFLLEKTGSISSLLMLATTLALAVEGGFWSRPRLRAPALLLSGAGVGLSALMNPVAVIIPGVVYGAALLNVIWEIRRSIGAAARALLLFGAAPLTVLFSDPYYLYRFVLQRPTMSLIDAGAVARDESFLRAVFDQFTWLLTTAQWMRPFLLFPYFGANPLSIVVIVTAISLLVLPLPPEKRYPALRLIGIVPLLIIVLEFVLLPVFSAVRSRGDYHILAPYFSDALVRFAYLWYISILVLVLAKLYQRLTPVRLGPLLFIVVVTVAMIPVRAARDSLPNQVSMRPRANLCNSLGCVRADDRVVLAVLRDKFDKYVSRGGSLDFRHIPKILVPNALLVFNREKWIMPTGAALVLPTISTFPVAFYYHQGSEDYTYANYVDHVCRRLDLPWLKERNIRFLFIPADRNQTCVDGLDVLLKDGNVLARSGNSALVELF